MGLRDADFLIDDNTLIDSIVNVLGPDGKLRMRGLVPRDMTVHPPDMFAPPSEIEIIPRSEWSERIKEGEAQKSFLSHLRGNIPSLDQDGVGYCWGHSTVQAVIAQRFAAHQPYTPLSAFAVCSIIKNGRDEGGWCGLSAKFVREVGVPPQSIWPQGSRDLSHDTPAMREQASHYQITEDWVDLTRQVYDQNLSFEQLMTCLLMRRPCPVDFNWWGHSVCALDPVEVEPGSFGIRIWNSWGDNWGDRGMGVLRGSKAIPNGALCVRVTTGD